MDVVFEHAEDITPDIKTFWFMPERPVRYLAGQFTELYLPHDNADDRGIRRWFTLSSSPTEDRVSITTTFAPTHGSSFKQQLRALTAGAPLKLADPMGDFVLPKDPTIPVLFVAAGLGITPVRSMIASLLYTGQKRDVRLIHAVREPADLAYEPLFRSYDMQYQPLVKQLNGPLTLQHILENAPDKRTRIYLSGPELMVETFYKELKTKGFSEDRLVTDYFPGYQQF